MDVSLPVFYWEQESSSPADLEVRLCSDTDLNDAAQAENALVWLPVSSCHSSSLP